MRRRRLLAALAAGSLAGAAGCSRDDDLRLTDFSEHEDLAVTFDGEVIQQPGDDALPRIELRFTNDGPEREIAFGPVAPITGLGDDDGTLVLIPDNREPLEAWDPDVPDTFVPESRTDGCWRALHSPARRPYLRGRLVYAGEQVTERYTLLAQADAEECFPPGTYRFEGGFSIRELHTLSVDVVVS